MRKRAFEDWLILVGGTAGLLFALAVGQAQARDATPAALANYRASLVGSGQDISAQLNLPEGVTIDPVTGLLVGVALEGEDGSKPVHWDVLQAYEYQDGLKDLPETIAKLDGEKVVMIGFLLPNYDYEDIRQFHLVASHWSCCYGMPPGITGAVYVDLAEGQDGLSITLMPLKITGTMRVKEIKDGGFVNAIYAIEDAKAVELTW